MRRLLFVIVMAFALTSCGEVKEEVWVESDQIRFDVTWDMTKEPASGGVSFGSLLSKLGSYMPASVNTTLMKSAFEQMGVPYNGQTKIDSTIYFDKMSFFNYNTLLSAIKSKDSKGVLTLKEQQALSKALCNAVKGGWAKCNIDAPANKYIFKLHIEWVDMDDFNTISRNLYKIDKEYGLDLHYIFEGNNNSFLFYPTNKGFVRGSCDYAHLIDVNGSGPFASDSRLEYIFGDGKSYDMVSIFHLPKKVSSMSNPKATLSGDKRTVTLKLTASDMSAGRTPANEIKY